MVRTVKRNSKEAKTVFANLSHGLSTNMYHDNRHMTAEDVQESLANFPKDKLVHNEQENYYAICHEYGGQIQLITK